MAAILTPTVSNSTRIDAAAVFGVGPDQRHGRRAPGAGSLVNRGSGGLVAIGAEFLVPLRPIPGRPRMPTLIAARREEYQLALRAADAGAAKGGEHLAPMIALVSETMVERLRSLMSVQQYSSEAARKGERQRPDAIVRMPLARPRGTPAGATGGDTAGAMR